MKYRFSSKKYIGHLIYSQTCPNDHLRITATCQQRPDLSHNDQPTTGLFQSTLCVTTTFFRSQGWPLYTGLTVIVMFQKLADVFRVDVHVE
jgi:hypothetical protein